VNTVTKLPVVEKPEVFNQVSDYQFFNKDSAIWS